MNLAGIVQNAVVLIKNVVGGTKGVLSDTIIERFTDTDDNGKPLYAIGETYVGFVDYAEGEKILEGGQIIVQKPVIIYVEPVEIDLRDRITLANGYTGPIKSIDGPLDATTDAPFYARVTLG